MDVAVGDDPDPDTAGAQAAAAADGWRQGSASQIAGIAGIRAARTATIAAITDGRLLRIERDDFLATVTGTPDGHQVAAEVAAAHLERDRATPST
jgi:CRP-like cAMP-binding protein